MRRKIRLIILRAIPTFISMFALGLLSILIYWSFFDTHVMRQYFPSTQTRNKANILTHEFHAGDVMYVYREFCNTTSEMPIRARSWFERDHEILFSLIAFIINERGCHRRWFGIPLPESMEPGAWRYHAELDFSVNPIKTESLQLPVVPFVILLDP